MILDHIVMYCMCMVRTGAKRAAGRAVKIVRGVYGRATQPASRARARTGQRIQVRGDGNVTAGGDLRVGLDPGGPGGLVAYHPAGERGERVITDRSREIMQAMGVDLDEAMERTARGSASAFRDIVVGQGTPGIGLAAYLNPGLMAAAAEAQARINRLRAVCPLATGGGCRDGSDCDARGECYAAALLDARHRDNRAALYDRAQTMTEIVEGMDPGEMIRLEDNTITRYPSTAELQEQLDMIESSESPPNEILCCAACGHPRHDYGGGRCAFLVHDDPFEPESHQSVCACTAGTDMIGWCPVEGAHVHEEDQVDSGAVPPDDEPVAETDGDRDRVITENDPAYNDLQTYLEGGTVESLDAAKRLDQRSVDMGQLSPKTFWDTWGRLPRPGYESHKIWCARHKDHFYEQCPVWGAE